MNLNFYKVGRFGKISIKNNKCRTGYVYEITDVSNHRHIGYIIKLNAVTLKAAGSTELNEWDVFVPIISPNIKGAISITHISRDNKHGNNDVGDIEYIDRGALQGRMHFLGRTKHTEHFIHIDIEGVNPANTSIYLLKNIAENEEYIKRYLKNIVANDGFGDFGHFVDTEFLEDIKPLEDEVTVKEDIRIDKPSFMTSYPVKKPKVNPVVKFIKKIFGK